MLRHERFEWRLSGELGTLVHHAGGDDIHDDPAAKFACGHRLILGSLGGAQWSIVDLWSRDAPPKPSGGLNSVIGRGYGQAMSEQSVTMRSGEACQACGAPQASAHEDGNHMVWLCAACAVFEGLGCP